MRKTALTLTVSTLVLGIFGAFLRWLQTMSAFEPETGFPIPGAGTTVVFLLFTLLSAAAFCVVTLLWLRGRYDSAPDAGTALKCNSSIPLIIAWVLCAAFAAASFLLLFSAGESRYPLGQRLFGAFGILAALSFPMLFGKKGSSGAGALGRSAAVVVTLFYCYWMVFCYKLNSEDPILWNFALEILAIVAAAAAFYFVASFFFDAGHASRALIAVELGVYLSVSTLFEERSTAMDVLLGVTAAVLLLLEYTLISNMTEKHDGI